MALHQQMATFLRLIFKYKKEKNYNFFSSLEDIKYMLHNKRFCLNNLDSHLACVKGFLVSDLTFHDFTNPLDDSA